MAKRLRSNTEGPGKPDEGEEEQADSGIIPVHPTVWGVRNAQNEINMGCRRFIYGHHEEQLNQTIELAVLEGDITAIAHLQTQVQEFRVLQNAMQGDCEALATIADAFAELGRYDYASAFNILAGRGAWLWESTYRKLDIGHRDRLLQRLQDVLLQSGKGARKKND